MADDVLQKVRNTVAENGNSELTALSAQPALNDMWKRLQEIRIKKYQAVQAAIEHAAKPFDEEITKLEAEYAFLLRLSA